MGISVGAWIAAPVLTFFWLYKGWPFWMALITTLMIDGVYYSFRYGTLEGILFSLSILIALWVNQDAKKLKIRFRFIFVILTFFILPLGLPIYLLIRKFLSRIEKIKTGDSTIEIYN